MECSDIRTLVIVALYLTERFQNSISGYVAKVNSFFIGRSILL